MIVAAINPLILRSPFGVAQDELRACRNGVSKDGGRFETGLRQA